MQTVIHSLSQLPLGFWGTIFAFLSFLLIVLLFFVVNNRTRSRDDLFAFLDKKIEDSSRSDLTKIQAVVNDSIQNANAHLRKEMNDSSSRLADSQNQNMVAFTELIEKINQGNANTQLQAREALKTQVSQLSFGINQELAGIRETLNRQLQTLQSNNDAKLEQMRHTVETKLQSTLETRLSESFKQVAAHLKDVEAGLGEMRTIAGQVGELKRVLTNVKTRGTFGEVQLGVILENIIPNHYEQNVATRPNSNDRVEFAIKMPGVNEGEFVWMPIDSKFPGDSYQALLDAQDSGDAVMLDKARKNLVATMKAEAKDIRDKYLEVPHTTEFGVMFLPTEGLYAEAVRLGMTETLQREYRVNIAGPSTMAALVNSLQMAFRTIAIQRRSDEVWKVLGVVKTEFERFETVLTKAQDQVDKVGKQLELLTGTRTRAMKRALRNVESMPDTAGILNLPEGLDDND